MCSFRGSFKMRLVQCVSFSFYVIKNNHLVDMYSNLIMQMLLFDYLNQIAVTGRKVENKSKHQSDMGMQKKVFPSHGKGVLYLTSQ